MIGRQATQITDEEKYYVASQWQLMGRKFRKHKLAILGGTVLAIFYVVAIFCEFFSTQDMNTRNTEYILCPPQKIHFFEENRFHLRPFVYGLKKEEDPETWARIYVEDPEITHPLYFFVHGDTYKLWNLFQTDIHFFGVKEGTVFLFGTDGSGRDLFSRNLSAARVSLSIGLLGVIFSFVLGCIMGGISGYYGGVADLIIQRIIEFLISIPTIPLWMALAAAFPKEWSSLKIYFSITIILSMVGWTSLARVIRGKLLEVREADFVIAARINGVSDSGIIIKHLLPSFFSYLIVDITLSIPRMIMAETALSFLGIGIRPPSVSWGVLLKDAQNIRTIALHPWLLLPAIFVILTVLTFNFLGDGLRDAADPYK